MKPRATNPSKAADAMHEALLKKLEHKGAIARMREREKRKRERGKQGRP